MNSRDRSLEDGPSIVTKAFPCISLVIPGHFYWFYRFYGGRGLGSVKGVPRISKRSTFKRLFRKLQVVCRLIEGWSGYLDGYNSKYL